MSLETNGWQKRKVVPYAAYMQDDLASLELKLDLEKPVAIQDFVETFAGLGSQFERYLKSQDDKRFADEVGIYVKEVREGSMIAELIPVASTMVSGMDQVIIVRQFSEFYQTRIAPYLKGNRADISSKTELGEVMQAMVAVANGPNGSAELKTVKYENGKRDEKVFISFRTKEAKKAVKTINDHIVEIEGKSSEIVENSLMVFFQSNTKNSEKPGDKAIIESISSKPLAVLYASDLAREKIKGEMVSGDRNIYKLGFFVDLYVTYSNGKPVSYHITAVRDVIDLPDDEDD